ncbi:ABC transporter permease [Curtobacterium sp. VKM Ac-2884]|uniref:ABC transporter permease n=1 Tax=Curtobacterium sp. VKM Ac-2884 TaxID=2783818 RepID=UPI00188D7C8E|nr:ABC transporter permease [Curtobacterium sp. VKM Ac-2884]MBF4603017.1 ABC transporter permease [Curtobacterium sp. VKM Ac-2884]
MTAIARAELLMLLRNRTVLASAVLLPIAFGAFFVFSGARNGSAAYASACIVVGLSAMGTYSVSTTTLAARRQTHFLKRLRSTVPSDVHILLGMTLPIVVVNLVQLAIVLIVLGATTGDPLAHPWLLGVTVIAAEAMFIALAMATAGVTGSPESAQYTCLPVFMGTIVVAVWALMSGQPIAGWLPGGGIALLAEASWTGDLGATWLFLLPTFGWVALGGFVAKLVFRWEIRS